MAWSEQKQVTRAALSDFRIQHVQPCAAQALVVCLHEHTHSLPSERKTMRLSKLVLLWWQQNPIAMAFPTP